MVMTTIERVALDLSDLDDEDVKMAARLLFSGNPEPMAIAIGAVTDDEDIRASIHALATVLAIELAFIHDTEQFRSLLVGTCKIMSLIALDAHGRIHVDCEHGEKERSKMN
jgi:hypothetical protein